MFILYSRYFKNGMTNFTLCFSSLTRSSEESQLIVRNTQNSRTFMRLLSSYIIWKRYRLPCGILIRIASYCPLIITIISGQRCSMLTKDYALCYSGKVRYTIGLGSIVTKSYILVCKEIDLILVEAKG